MTIQEKAAMWAKSNGLAELQAATLAARERTGENWSTRVRGSLFQVCTVEYGKKTTVKPICGYVTKARAIEILEAQ